VDCLTHFYQLCFNKRWLLVIPFLKNNDCLEYPNCPGRGASRSAPTKMPLLSLADYEGNGINITKNTFCQENHGRLFARYKIIYDA
jgi:hypothetical protein